VNLNIYKLKYRGIYVYIPNIERIYDFCKNIDIDNYFCKGSNNENLVGFYNENTAKEVIKRDLSTLINNDIFNGIKFTNYSVVEIDLDNIIDWVSGCNSILPNSEEITNFHSLIISFLLAIKKPYPEQFSIFCDGYIIKIGSILTEIFQIIAYQKARQINALDKKTLVFVEASRKQIDNFLKCPPIKDEAKVLIDFFENHLELIS